VGGERVPVPLRIGVLGAGAIGWYVGARLIACGSDVVVVGRRPLDPVIEKSGLVLTDLNGGTSRVESAKIAYHTSASALTDRDIVLCCVKSGQTEEAARELAETLGPRRVVVSLQNGLGNAAALRSVLVGSVVLGGIVGFNVVARGGGEYRRTTSGPLVIEASSDERVTSLSSLLEKSGFEVKLAADIRALQWAKLLMNLNNAVSALSDVPTKELLLLEGYRRIIAAVLTEALGVLRKAGIRPASLTGLPIGWFPFILGLPTPLLRLITRTQLKIDPEARSSMWEDLTKGRLTEVDYLNGEIVRLGQTCNAAAPLNRRIVEIVHAAEARKAGSPRLSAEELWRALYHGHV
jgi:2-dehydropantoate 2-reductase